MSYDKMSLVTGSHPALKQLLETLRDVRHELDEPEVAELVSLALDKKVDRAIKVLEELTSD